MNMLEWYEFISPIWLSLKIGFVASVLVFLIGGFAAWFMAKKRFRGKIVIETIFILPLVLSPTVIGFVLLVLLGRESWIGRAIEWLFNQPIVFTWWAAVIAAIVVAFPLVYQTMKVGFTSVDKELEDVGRSMGASEWQLLTFVTIPLCIRSIVTAYILGFARALGEFGATLMIAGNIPGRTQTVPTAIYIAVDSGNIVLATYWTITIIAVSFFLLLFTHRSRT